MRTFAISMMLRWPLPLIRSELRIAARRGRRGMTRHYSRSCAVRVVWAACLPFHARRAAAADVFVAALELCRMDAPRSFGRDVGKPARWCGSRCGVSVWPPAGINRGLRRLRCVMVRVCHNGMHTQELPLSRDRARPEMGGRGRLKGIQGAGVNVQCECFYGDQSPQ